MITTKDIAGIGLAASSIKTAEWAPGGSTLTRNTPAQVYYTSGGVSSIKSTAL